MGTHKIYSGIQGIRDNISGSLYGDCHELLALKVHFVRHFASAIFVVTSRVESLPTGSQKHLWDLYEHVFCLVSYKNIFLV